MPPKCAEAKKAIQIRYREKHRELINQRTAAWKRNKRRELGIMPFVKKYKEPVQMVLKIKMIKEDRIFNHNLQRKLKYKTSKGYRDRCIARSVRRQLDPNQKTNILVYKRRWYKEKKSRDPIFKMAMNIRSRAGMAFAARGWKKNCSIGKIIGADWETVSLWLENQFKPGMSWSNHGSWHIDHKIPLCSAKTYDDLIFLFNYKNLQPLWAVENLKKGRRLWAV